MSKYLMFDVGGTGVKHAFLDEKGMIISPVSSFPSQSRKSADEVFSSFADVIRKEDDICGVGMAWPGPFDYEKGISLMNGLGKYQAIYMVDVGQGIRDALGNEGLEFRYDHDVAAFLSGYVRSEGLCDKRVIALVLGTGAGSAFSVNGKCVGSETEGVPENGWIYNAPFLDTVIEEWLSSKGIEKLSLKYFGKIIDGKTLQMMADEGNADALRLWLEFGKVIKEGMTGFIASFKATDIVFGGMISKAWKYFSPAFADDFTSMNVTMHVTYESSRYVFRGLYTLFGGKDE
ncbi:MAG: ROK family protein [Bullifex sp.]